MVQQYILGIECTAHTFGIAILTYEKDSKKSKILVNIKDSFSTESGGMIPNEVAKHHRAIADSLYQKALDETKIDNIEKNIRAIAVSNAPGLAPCLIEGMKFAKKLCEKLNVPLVPVNHCIAHLEIGDIGCSSETSAPTDPVLLYASGANTQIIAYEAGKYRIFGETLDVGVGNFIDTFARYAGIGFPGGPKIQKLASECKTKDDLIEMPYSIKGMDVAFSGILTKLKNFIENKKYSIEELSYSMQETVFAMLVEASERAIAHTGKKELLLGGGVACNSRLQEMCKIMCDEREQKVKYFCPPIPLLVDNAGMIGYLGLKMLNAGIFYAPDKLDEVDINPRERTDDVDVKWR
ncbi:MAG: KEOPS complex N(6)-L-threonylcarbamoyladenine synthase Kae1 [archaeon]